MISSIIDGIIAKLKTAGLDVDEFAYKDLIDGSKNIRRPAVNVTCNNSGMKKIAASMNQPIYKHELKISVILVVQYIGSTIEKEGIRKTKIYDLIEAINTELTNESFGLALENPLFPAGWRNITTLEMAIAQYQLYQIDFTCSFIIEPEDKDTVIGQLNYILSRYWIEPDRDIETDDPDASDKFELT